MTTILDRITVMRSHTGTLWIEPNRNGLLSYVWPKLLPGRVYGLVRGFRTRTDAATAAAEMGLRKTDVRLFESRFEWSWCIVGNEGGILADPIAVDMALADVLRNVICGPAEFLPKPN